MKTNESNLDRALRIIVGIGILSLAFVGPQSSWAYLGIIPLVTGIIGFCPLYKFLDISTCSMRKNRYP